MHRHITYDDLFNYIGRFKKHEISVDNFSFRVLGFLVKENIIF